tara:strand:+ start:1246 stop:1707 length:462 start_codon:yes stop_codon:yes gene_type:complete
MATTTATITLNSSDILSQAISLSSTMTLYKGGTTATGLEQLNYHRAIIPTGTNFDLIPESDALKDNSNYLYICNKNTDVTHYVTISINGEVVGSLYAGDFMFFPWANDLSDQESTTDQTGNDSTIEIQAFTASNTIEYALFHVGETLLTAGDS